jgi:2'-5' RNA ligase
MAQIYAVVSLLGGDAHDEVMAIWQLLERRFGLRGAQEAIFPHVTYFVGEGGDLPTLHECVAAAAEAEQPLSITLDGLGLFPLPAPVLFLRAVRSAALARLYGRVLDAARCAGTTIWPHYTPEMWVPHVTLALRDLHPSILPEVVDALRHCRLRMRTPLAELQIVRVRRPLSDSEYVGVFPLGQPGIHHEDAKTRRG